MASPMIAAVLAAIAAAALAPGDRDASQRVARLLSPSVPSRWRPTRRRRRPPPAAGPLALDLVCAVLRAGAPVTTSVRAVGECLGTYGAGGGQNLVTLAQRHELALAEPMPGAPPWVALLDETLLLARDAGLSPAPLLSAAAEDERRRVGTAQRLAAARLGVRVVLPTGLCLLPAFVLFSVVPLVVALLGVPS